MSDFKIQTTSLDELAGGQRPLTPPADRRGNEYPQSFPLTGAKAVEVNNDQAASVVRPNIANGAGSRPSESVSGLNAGNGRAINVKPVDRRTIEGSTPGDFRKSGDTAKDSILRAANGQGGPRSPVGQFPNGKA
jgi:hypothetical protein